MSKSSEYIEIFENSEWEVLTPEGFKDFKGVSKTKKPTVQVLFSSGKRLICTEDHKIFTDDGHKINAGKSINSKVTTSEGVDTVIKILTTDIIEDVYDLLTVKDTSSFYCNTIHVSNCLFLDECAFVSDYIWDEFFNSVLPTISGGKTSKIIMVSTPKGMNHFYKIYKDAAEDRSNFAAIKVPWWERPDRDEAWKKNVLMEMGGDIIRFNQEYGCVRYSTNINIITEDNAKLEVSIGSLFDSM